ncbi:MAG: response regulator [bacterium]|nr:response regulator [bacterium]
MKRILIIEEDTINNIVLWQMLDKNGFPNDAVKTSGEALGLFEDNNYSLVLIDTMLPGVDGIETMKEMKKRNPNIPVVAITASLRPGSEELLLGIGFYAFLAKPYMYDEVETILQGCVKQAS